MALRADHGFGELGRMNLMEAKLRRVVALKNDVIDELKDSKALVDKACDRLLDI